MNILIIFFYFVQHLNGTKHMKKMKTTSQYHVESYLKCVVNYAAGTISLIILDDCASGKFVKNRTSEVVKLAFSA